MLDKMFSNSNIDLNYNFIEFTVNEKKNLNRKRIKRYARNDSFKEQKN